MYNLDFPPGKSGKVHSTYDLFFCLVYCLWPNNECRLANRGSHNARAGKGESVSSSGAVCSASPLESAAWRLKRGGRNVSVAAFSFLFFLFFLFFLVSFSCAEKLCATSFVRSLIFAHFSNQTAEECPHGYDKVRNNPVLLGPTERASEQTTSKLPLPSSLWVEKCLVLRQGSGVGGPFYSKDFSNSVDAGWHKVTQSTEINPGYKVSSLPFSCTKKQRETTVPAHWLLFGI